jgi:hypothetical protein
MIKLEIKIAYEIKNIPNQQRYNNNFLKTNGSSA